MNDKAIKCDHLDEKAIIDLNIKKVVCSKCGAHLDFAFKKFDDRKLKQNMSDENENN